MEGALQLASAERARRILRRSLDVIAKEIRDLVMRLDTESGDLTRDRGALANATRVRSQILAYLRERGVPLIRDSAEEAMADAATRAIRDLDMGDFAARITPTLETVLSDRFNEIARAVVDVGGDTAKLIRTSMTTGAPLSRLLDGVSGRLDVATSHIETVVETAVSGVQRQVQYEGADSAAEGTGEEVVFEYIGPRSGIVRDFCSRLLSKTTRRAYAKRYIDGLSPADGQPGPVSAYCGGYNCRHEWVPLLRERAEAKGYTIME